MRASELSILYTRNMGTVEVLILCCCTLVTIVLGRTVSAILGCEYGFGMMVVSISASDH